MILLRSSSRSKSKPLDLLFLGMTFVFVVQLSNAGVEAGPGSEIRDDRDLLTYTKAEAKGLEKLKHKVLPHLTDYFMRTDYYLIRWLRMTNLDVERAKDLIIEDIRWRERANIKGILDEDFSDISQDYELTLGEDSSDIFGRPVGTLPLGDWRLRDAIVLGKKPRLQRYLTQSLEKGMFTMIYRLLQTNQTVASAVMLIDGEGGNVLQHLCGQCLGILAEWLWTMETHYPKANQL